MDVQDHFFEFEAEIIRIHDRDYRRYSSKSADEARIQRERDPDQMAGDRPCDLRRIVCSARGDGSYCLWRRKRQRLKGTKNKKARKRGERGLYEACLSGKRIHPLLVEGRAPGQRHRTAGSGFLPISGAWRAAVFYCGIERPKGEMNDATNSLALPHDERLPDRQQAGLGGEMVWSG